MPFKSFTMGLKALKSKMPRPSRLEAFLKSFPESHRGDIEGEILKCRDSKAAHIFLKGHYKYKGSYDSVKNWRQARSDRREIDRSLDQSSRITDAAARMPLEGDPIAAVMNLAQELNSLCVSLTSLLQNHQWLEPGEVRLSNREAAKILGALPSLVRASAGSLLEMSKVKAEMDQKVLMLATIEELATDWRQMLKHDNPELVPLLESAAAVTKARLELDRSSLLEKVIDGN